MLPKCCNLLSQNERVFKEMERWILLHTMYALVLDSGMKMINQALPKVCLDEVGKKNLQNMRIQQLILICVNLINLYIK